MYLLEWCNPAREAAQLCSCLASPVPWEQGTKRHLKHILGESQWDWCLKRTMPTRDWTVSETWKGLSAGLGWANVAGDVCMCIVIPTVSFQPLMPEEKVWWLVGHLLCLKLSLELAGRVSVMEFFKGLGNSVYIWLILHVDSWNVKWFLD